MGKSGGFLTPKAIANRIKSKGLQKLRWYCQMCQKQCRDENGFKCHLTSESHQRQLLLFADNPNRFISEFSSDFKDGYLHLLKRQFGTKRVSANVVYQDYIHDKDHIHMNSTEWETLTDFVKWLGKQGEVVADETEKGWFITYIDRDWEAIKRQEELAKKEKMEMTDDDRNQKFLERQIASAKKTETEKEAVQATELQRQEGDESKVAFALAGTSSGKPKESLSSSALDGLKSDKAGASSKPSSSSSASKRKMTALDDIMKNEEQIKEKKNRKDYWLHDGIVVKVLTKKLGDKYYKKKGYVQEVKDRYVGIVKMLETGDRIKLDQEHLETVIPNIGKTVKIVNGAYRGYDARLEKLDEKKFSCSLTISAGPLTGRRVEGIPYEDMSKLHTAS